jgi:2,4-dienoyl-CoA reductase-like NADH-dependent reductase (Old Yellow Enzyme family)
VKNLYILEAFAAIAKNAATAGADSISLAGFH